MSTVQPKVRGRPRKPQNAPASPQVKTIARNLKQEIEILKEEINQLREENIILNEENKFGINDTLEKLNNTLLNLNKPPEQQTTLQPKQEPLTLSFEDYSTYFSIISSLNDYIKSQIMDIDNLNKIGEYLNIIIKFEPNFINRNKDILNIIEEYNKTFKDFEKTNDIELITDLYNLYNLDTHNIEIMPLPNIDPTVKKMKLLQNKTLIGTNNIIFTKLKTEKKTSFDDILGDYTRIDIPNAVPCKLRVDPKNGQNPFYVLQGDKKFLFNNIENSKNFCLNGGYQADFINSKNNIDYENKYKNKYVPAYVYR